MNAIKFLIFIFTLAIFVKFPQDVIAEDASTLVNTINAFNHGGSGSLSASASGNTVTVTGNVSGATNTLILDIDSNAEVVWKADFRGDVSGIDTGLFSSGPGGIIQTDGGRAIRSTCSFCNTDPCTGVVNITGLANSGAVRTAIMNAVNTIHPVVYVVGDFSGAGSMSSFNIPANKTVEWSANYSGSAGAIVATDGMSIQFSNSTLTMTGGEITNDTGIAVSVSSNATLTVNGGIIDTANGTAVYVNGNTISDANGNILAVMDVTPMIINGRAFVPLRFLAEMLGAGISWNETTREVTLFKDGEILTVPIGTNTPELTALGMEVPAQIVGGRTMVPVRFITEFFGAEVTWNYETRTLLIVY
jgi:hypothetical protein